MNSDMTREKMRLRAEMKARRALLKSDERAKASRALGHRVALWLDARPERAIGVYLARPEEISLDGLIEELLRRNYQIAAPRVNLANGTMSFWRLESLSDLEIGPFQVRQPKMSEPMPEIETCLVPGLAFDVFGHRLGSGGGWYDRFLQPEHTVIGAGFDWQILPRVPSENHDRAVDFVASECRWIEVGK